MPAKPHFEKKWNFFIYQVSDLFLFWLIGVIYFFLFRLFFIAFFSKEISNGNSKWEYLKVLYMGFKFDSSSVSYFTMLPFITLLFLIKFRKFDFIKKINNFFYMSFAIITAIISVVTINFYMEYNNQFNNFLFLALYDDKNAVTNTIIKDYNPIANLLLIVLISVALILIKRYFNNKQKIYSFLIQFNSKKSKIILCLLIVIFFISSLRGSFGIEPVKRRMASISSDVFLNKTIVNPIRSLLYAYTDFNDINNTNGKNPFLSKKDFENIFTKNTVQEYLVKKTNEPMIEKPKQIFLIIMESYDSWPLMDKYKDLNVSDNLRRISENGILFNHFLPAATATFESYSSIVTNVPNCGVNISQIGATKEKYITSLFTQFKKLGYKTNLFYGGLSSWQNISEFSKHQGVDNFYSGPEAGGNIDDGLWGVPDRNLFNLVLKKVNPNEFSLNVILTTSYHPPFSINLENEKFIYKSIDDLPKNALKYYDDGMTLKELGHLWYSDKAIGEFVNIAERKFNSSLFCFTGDHFGRRFVNHKPSLYEKCSVPFILYGKDIKKGIKITTPGTHIDIMPTLIEMVAPKNFVYYSFGSSLFSKNKNSAIAYRRYINKNELYMFPKDEKIQKQDLITGKEKFINQTNYEKEHNKLMAFSWHYIIKGNSLKKKK